VWTTRATPWRQHLHNVGGRVEVGDGVLMHQGRVIWRASDEPFAERLARVVAPLAEELALMLRDGVDRLRPVDTLWLDNFTRSAIIVVPGVGYVDRADRWEGFEGPPWELRCDDDEGTLLRAAALAVAEPVTEVTEAVARALIARDWRGVIKATPELVVMVGQYGDDQTAKAASLQRLNPPQRVERWLSEPRGP
jgi:hypothetical protein